MTSGETARASYQLTVSTTALRLVASNYAGPLPNRAIFTVEGASVRLRYDGVDPTADEGHKLDSGQTATLEGTQNIAAAKLIRDGSSDAPVFVTLEAP